MPISKPLLLTLLKSTALVLTVFGTASFISVFPQFQPPLERSVVEQKNQVPEAAPDLPKHARIIAKYVTLDEKKSISGSFCDQDSVLPFLKMKDMDCMFTLQDLQFKIDDKLVLDEGGKLVKYINYLPMGPLIYNKKDLSADTTLVKSLQLNSFFVQISADKTRIMDAQDTLEIEKIYPKEKLMMMKQNEQLRTKGQRIFYQYKVK